MSALRTFEPDEAIDLALSGETAAAVDTLLRELKCVDRFLRAGVDPPTRVLFSGPSGTGKTLAARWLGHKLKLRTMVVDVAAVIGSHLGETSKALRECFEGSPKSILFLDEIDAICAKRSGTTNGAASAELARATTTFFQQVDWLPPARIVIAATNFRDELDPALRRRLTTDIIFELPDRDARRRMLEAWLGRSPLCAEQLDAIADGSEGLSGADLRSRAMAMARRAVMAGPEPAREPARDQEFLTDLPARAQQLLDLLDKMGGPPT